MIKQKIRFSEPAFYNITVKGELTQESLEIIANFFKGQLLIKQTNNNTNLEGFVKDQIALSGLLDYLCNSHYVLLSVKTINNQNIDQQ